VHPQRLHPLLGRRFSPSSFDRAHDLAPDEIDLLLEAARWAPSAGNSQPWAFIVGRRGDDVHARLVRYLAGSSATWAPSAGVLIANLSHRYVEDTSWEYSEFALYDLGQAVAHLTFQAQAMGMFVRQFRAFDRRGITSEFHVPPHWEVTTMSAIGRPCAPSAESVGHPSPLTRQRRPLASIRWARSASAD
jgi:nitroreductase